MKKTILHYPDPRLREVSKPIKQFDQKLKTLAYDMLETMYDAKGIGLAAPQVGELINLLVIDSRPRRSRDIKKDDDESEAIQTPLELKIEQPLVVINPKIIAKKGSTVFDEGCLSVPSFYETVKRALWIELEYQDLDGNTRRIQTDGLLAIVIQHEMDHLEGTLFIDRISFTKSQKIKKQIEKQGYPTKPEVDKDQEAL